MSKVFALRSFLDDPLPKKIVAPSAPITPIATVYPEAELIKQLRHEANQEKETFGWHAFQALSISSVALGGILYFMFSHDGFPAVGLAALPILAFVLVTCRLGDSCYSSANRHFGYELFLYRVRSIQREVEGRWRREFREIEWEAAMRAWRLAQASLYEAIYFPGNYLTIDKLRPTFDTKRKSLWFCQGSLSQESGAKFHAGSYLSRMHTMLLLVGAASIVILWVTVLAVIFRPLDPKQQPGILAGIKTLDGLVGWTGVHASVTVDRLNLAIFLTCLLVAIVATYVLIIRARAERAKRKIMEDGLLSIHACSVTWQAVVLAHFNTVDRGRASGLTSWKLVELSRRARERDRVLWNGWRAGTVPFERLLSLFTESEKGPRDEGAGVAGFSFWLGEESASLARCAADVPGWIALGEEGLRARKLV